MTRFKTVIAAGALVLAALCAHPGQAKAGDYCREYTRTVVIGGRVHEAYGTACLGPDGAWRIADENLAGNNAVVVDGRPYPAQNVTYVIHDGPRTIYRPRIQYVDYYYRPAPVYAYPVYGFGYYNGHHDRGWHRGWDWRH